MQTNTVSVVHYFGFNNIFSLCSFSFFEHKKKQTTVYVYYICFFQRLTQFSFLFPNSMKHETPLDVKNHSFTL